MKTNKTKEQAWKLERPERFISTNQVYNAGWNAALASVVDEPVLTEDARKAIFDICTEAWESKARWTHELRDQIMPKIDALLAGRIPASKPTEAVRECPECGTPINDNGYGAHHSASCQHLNRNFNATPQQEGGLTREWLRLQLGHCLSGTSPANTLETIWNKIQSDKASSLVSGDGTKIMTQEEFAGLESVHDHITVWKRYRESLEAKEADVRSWISDQLGKAQKEIETLRTELANAKKGRYALGDKMEATTDGEIYWKGVVGFIPDLQATTLPWKDHRGIATTPTVEQMETEYLKWLRGTGDVTITMESALGILVKELQQPSIKGDMGLLYRRDCLGGVE